jgi:linoleoyl-CoA desaturase
MAITDIKEYSHLTDADVEALGAELDAIRADIEESRGARDARYIDRTIKLQRSLAIAGRVVLFGSRKRPAWILGTALMGAAKIIENMELGHNVIHGQWEWMKDPEIHSSNWEWYNTCTSAGWKQSHNYVHHKFTNIVGLDSDVGYGILRMTRDQKWSPVYLAQPFYNVLLALLFEWGVALHHLDVASIRRGDYDRAETLRNAKEVGRKIARQVGKDYVVFPALTGPAWKSTLTANITANVIRNLWAYGVIFCGHFPDGAEKFTKEEFEKETKAEWYLRQMLGSANFNAGPVLAFMSGNLCYQIEHHAFPDLPSNRYAEIGVKMRELCDKYDLPYTTGSLPHQYGLTLRTIFKLALPNRFLSASADDAPETASELRFRIRGGMKEVFGVDPATGKRRGLRTALAMIRN